MNLLAPNADGHTNCRLHMARPRQLGICLFRKMNEMVSRLNE